MEKNINKSMVIDVQNIKKMAILWLIPLGFISATAIQALATVETKAATKIPPADRKAISQKIFKVRLPFIENQGQIADKNVLYYTKTFGGTAFVTQKGELVYSFARDERDKNAVAKAPAPEVRKIWTLKETLVGTSTVNLQGTDPARTKVNYFIGSEKSKWRTNIPTYNSVSLGEVYKGIVLSLKAHGKSVEKIFTVQPGADLTAIKLKIEGANSLKIASQGELEVETGLGAVSFSKPVAYQERNGKRKTIKVAYQLLGDKYGFKVDDYDKSFPLVIDPALSWNTFMGSDVPGDYNFGHSIALDGSGNIYVAGESNNSWGTPVRAFTEGTNGYEYDGFVAKLDNNGELLWNTFIGSADDDYCRSLAVDDSGNVYVAGFSRDTWGSPVNSHTGAEDHDAFAAKLNTNGLLLWNTFIGSGGVDYSHGIAVDGSLNVYVAGKSESAWGLPVNPFAGGDQDAFVAKLDSSGTLVWHTFMGGAGSYNDDDDARSLAIDGFGNIYVAGFSKDTWGLPVNPHADEGNVYPDAFAAKLNSSGELQWNTFMGSPERSDSNFGPLAVDGSGNVYVGGTSGATWGTPVNPYAGGSEDTFVAQLDSSGGGLLWNTFMGGAGFDRCSSLAVDGSGNVYVLGTSTTTWGAPAYPYTGGAAFSDVFAAKLDSSGALSWNTFMGGTRWEQVGALAVDGYGYIYVVGGSQYFGWGEPINPHTGGDDVFVAKLFETADGDGDGLTYYEEVILGTYDNLADSDGDGVNDLDDPFPTDPNESADSDGNTIRISPAGSTPYSPWIWGNKVVWEDERPGSGQHDLYIYDLSDGSGMWLTNDSGWEERPRICGNRIVWEEWDSSNGYEIYIYDLEEATPTKTKITNGSGALEFPHISGDRVVYSNPYWSDPVWAYDLTTSSEAQISLAGVLPMINGDWVVWAEQTPSNNTHLWLRCFTPAGSLCPIPEGTITDITDFPTGIGSLPYFEISADNVVYDYFESVSNSYGINLYNRTSDTTTPLTTGPEYDSPSISGNRVTWTDGYTIYMRDLLTSDTTVVTTDDTSWKYYRSMFGGRVVWLDDRDGSDNVYVYTGDGVGDSSDNCPTDYNPSQADNDIDGADGFGDVCDNCPNDYNPGQDDIDADGIGSVCDPCPNELLTDVPTPGDLNDFDGDGLCYNEEIALGSNPNSNDSDGDTHLDGEDYFPTDPTEWADFDGDGVGDNGDNCPERDNGKITYAVTDSKGNCGELILGLTPGVDQWQPDYDCDGIGDDCDNDADGDGYDSYPEGDDCDDLNEFNYPGCTDPSADCPCDGQISSETPPTGNCNPNQDCDGDGVDEKIDNCPGLYNDQTDTDGDLKGDLCDNCPTVANADQTVPVWYKDYDLDGYHNGDTVTQCERPTPITEYKSESELQSLEIDCDDNDGTVYPDHSDVNSNCDPSDDTVSAEDYNIQVVLERCSDDSCSSTTPLTYGNWDPADGDHLRATFKAFRGETEFFYSADPNERPRMNANFNLGYAVLSLGGPNPSRLRGKYLNDDSENGVATPADDYESIVFGENNVRFVCRDYGGSLTIHAEVSITKADDTLDTLSGDFAFPKDTDGDGLPDFWESPKGNLLPDADPDNDGIPTSGEYRGVRWGTTVPESADFTVYDTDAYVPEATPDGLVKHFRLDPQNHRDLFVLFEGFDARFPFAVGTAFEDLPSKVAVHALGTNLGGSLGQNNIDVTTVTLVDGVLGLENDNIDRWTTRSWTFSTLGKSIFGGDNYYGSYCRVFKKSLEAFFDDKPHYDYTTCDGCSKNEKKVQNNWDIYPSGKMESIIYVEDGNDNGNTDVREDATGNGRLDGDYPVRIDLVDPDQAYSDKGMTPPTLSADIDNDGIDEEWDPNFDLSPFDIDGDGMVELPVVAFLNEIDQLTENSEAQAAKMIITHELGHNTGITIHTSDSTCAMNNESNNLIRDNHFSQDAAALVRIHNAPYQP